MAEAYRGLVNCLKPYAQHVREIESESELACMPLSTQGQMWGRSLVFCGRSTSQRYPADLMHQLIRLSKAPYDHS